jgi:glycine/D-amino acid oxidase-like deaminating enzyme
MIGVMSADIKHMSQLPSSVEIAIIGAGIMGLCTGLCLARSGREVVVLDRSEPWREASGVNAGGLGVQNKRLPLIPLALEGVKIWKGFRKELGKDVGYVSSGGIRVATSGEEVQRLRDSVTMQRKVGLELEWLEGSELRSKAPWISDEVCAATYCAADSFADPLIAGNALVASITEAGGKIIPRAEVININEKVDGFLLGTSAGNLSCRRLIIATAVWSRQLVRPLGVDLPIALDVNVVSATEPVAPVVNLLVTHIRGILSLKQFPHGTCVIGGGWQGLGSLKTGQKDLDYVSLLHNLRLAVKIVPSLANVRLVRSWAGFEGVTPDSLPFFGKLPGHPNVFVIGCARGGWTIGPYLGRLMAELVLTNKTSYPMHEFDLRRVMN